MSAFGTKRTSKPPLKMSALGGKADIPDARSNVCLSLKTGFPGMRHILSKFGIEPLACCRASSHRRQPLLTGPDGHPVTVRAFSRQQDAHHPSTITLMLR
jgi:hypothetical protein